jgi:heat shock protein HslJ
MISPSEGVELPAGLESKSSEPGEASQTPGRLSLDTIAGREWVLEEWDRDEAAPGAPPVTLSYDGGRFVGNGGCNRYFAPATPGSSPGDVSVGAVGATRMFCPDPASTIEARFFKQLAAVRKFGFPSGKLALTYEVEGKPGVMLFKERKR